MISAKTYVRATSPDHALSLAKGSAGSFRYLAGGTDVLVNKYQGNENAGLLIDLTGIEALKETYATETHLVIGALLTLDALEKHPLITRHFPLLAEATHSVASPTIRKTATLGGNLLCENRCLFYNQSEWWRDAAGRCLKCQGDACLASGGGKNCLARFVSDTAVALISLHAKIEVVSDDGNKVVLLESIYTGDGINPNQLGPSSIIKAIHIPFAEGSRSVYKKLRKRESLDFTSLTTAVTLYRDGSLRMVLGGVHAKPVIIDGSRSDDPEVLAKQARTGSRVIDNDTFSVAYRRDMILVFLQRSFNELQSL